MQWEWKQKIVVMCLLLGVGTALGDGGASSPLEGVPPSAEEIARLVTKLGDPEYKIREESKQRLLDWGVTQPERLLALLPDKHEDPEIQIRCEDLRKRIFLTVVASARAKEPAVSKKALAALRQRDQEFLRLLEKASPSDAAAYDELTIKVQTPAVRDWVAQSIPGVIGEESASEEEAWRVITKVSALCCMNDDRGYRIAFEALRSREQDIHRLGETVFLNLYERGQGDWARIVPVLIEALHPRDDDAAQLLDVVLGTQVLKGLKYRSDFDKVQAGFREWWTLHGKGFDPVKRAFESLRLRHRVEAHRFLEKRAPFDAGYQRAAEEGTRRDALKQWEAWYDEHRETLWFDVDQLSWRVDKEAKLEAVR